MILMVISPPYKKSKFEGKLQEILHSQVVMQAQLGYQLRQQVTHTIHYSHYQSAVKS